VIAQPDAGAGGSDFTWQAIDDIAMTGLAVSLGFRF
jgi:hypothetical protein